MEHKLQSKAHDLHNIKWVEHTGLHEDRQNQPFSGNTISFLLFWTNLRQSSRGRL